LKLLFLYIPLLLFFLQDIDTDGKKQRNSDTEKFNDSISLWIAYSKDRNINYQKRKHYLDKAYKGSIDELNDSLRCVYLTKVSFTYYFKLGDSLMFRKINKESINLSLAMNDSVNLAANYWDLGEFYTKNGIKDSAYFAYSKAQKIYASLNDNFYAGSMLLNMAIIQSDIKDYTGSETSTIKAIALLKPIKKYKHLYRCYNNLGINFNNLEEYESALFYHNEALKYEKFIKTKNTFKASSINNIGVVYKNKEDYHKAIEYYQRAFETKNLKRANTRLYAKLLDNLAYSQFKLGNTTGIKESFFKSLKIRDSIQDHLGIAINKLHLAEYYATVKDTIQAMQFAQESKQLAHTTKNHRELLASLLLLSRLDRKNSHIYTKEYIKRNDSLQKEERAIRNKFARIRFETDEFIVENERLSRQKELMLVISGLILLFGSLLYIIMSQRAKNKNLQFEQQQQTANEEIYNLMISQQHKLDEVKRKEKERISQELHDGVLGKLFGTRLILGTLNAKTDKETVLKREQYINELQDVEEEIRNVSHELYEKSLAFDTGFVHMIDNLLKNQSTISKFDYEFNYDKSTIWEEINGSLKMNLFRILQEAIQNINKYAKAKNVIVEFKVVENHVHLMVSDDGIGFNSESKNRGIGLKNIRSRTDKLNGKLTIKTQPNKGTSILIRAPYK